MKLKRIADGVYVSECGRACIKRQVSQRGWRKETSWSVEVDGKWIRDYDLKKDATRVAESTIQANDEHAQAMKEEYDF